MKYDTDFTCLFFQTCGGPPLSNVQFEVIQVQDSAWHYVHIFGFFLFFFMMCSTICVNLFTSAVKYFIQELISYMRDLRESEINPKQLYFFSTSEVVSPGQKTFL